MPTSFVKLLRDPDARHRLRTWQPVIVSLAALVFVFYMAAYALPKQSKDVSQLQTQADDASQRVLETCRELRRRQVRANSEIRIPLRNFGRSSAQAWQELFDLFVKNPPPPDATPQQLRDREQFFALLRRVQESAAVLGDTIKVPSPVDCDTP